MRRRVRLGFGGVGSSRTGGAATGAPENSAAEMSSLKRALSESDCMMAAIGRGEWDVITALSPRCKDDVWWRVEKTIRLGQVFAGGGSS